MLIRDNFRAQFYDVIKKTHVLLIVGGDVDALCAYMILSQLLKCDDVPHSAVPVDGWESLNTALQDHCDSTKTVVLINCGGNRTSDRLQIPDGCNVFILDSRRPFNHEDVFDPQQVRILVNNSELTSLKIPDVKDVMEEESDGEDSGEGSDVSDEESEDGRRDAMERVQQRVIKKERKRLWAKRRKDILWQYYETAWYSSTASAVHMLEIAASLNRSSADLMWLAAVGLNSQFVEKLISVEAYTAACIDRMKPFIQKFSPRNDSYKADDVLRVGFEKQLPLAMYSHWSLHSAMKTNEYFACKTRNWTQRGDSEVRHLLAKLGLTLIETRQKFDAMSTERRKEVIDTLEAEMVPKFASFVVHLGYHQRLNAADVARAVAARLETPRREPLVKRFDLAASALKSIIDIGGQFHEMNKCIERYKVGLEVIHNRLCSSINQSEIIPTGPFFLFVSPQHIDSDFLESRHFLYLFTNFLQNAFASMRRGRTGKPLIVSFPLGGEDIGWHIVTGVMPLATVYDDLNKKSFIGKAFENVSQLGNIRMKRDFFDPNIITIRSDDRSRFFDGLQAVIETR